MSGALNGATCKNSGDDGGDLSTKPTRSCLPPRISSIKVGPIQQTHVRIVRSRMGPFFSGAQALPGLILALQRPGEGALGSRSSGFRLRQLCPAFARSTDRNLVIIGDRLPQPAP
jgi:hypothetical protein